MSTVSIENIVETGKRMAYWSNAERESKRGTSYDFVMRVWCGEKDLDVRLRAVDGEISSSVQSCDGAQKLLSVNLDRNTDVQIPFKVRQNCQTTRRTTAAAALRTF